MPKATLTGASVAKPPAALPVSRAEYERAKAALVPPANRAAHTRDSVSAWGPRAEDQAIVSAYENHRATGQAAYDQAVTRIARAKSAGQRVSEHDVARVQEFDRWARESGL